MGSDSSIQAWTDYPFLELGDTPNEIAPIRQILVHAYDRNKYCLVEVDGIFAEIKSGYIYRRAGRCGERNLWSKRLMRLPTMSLYAKKIVRKSYKDSQK